MPVTAKLSRKFYERFGDEIANELVEWFNQVDSTYRLEFRDLFDTNFARFDAKLEQRLAEIRADLQKEIGELRSEMRIGLGTLEGRLEGRLTGEVAGLEGRLTGEMAGLEGRLLARLGVLEGRFGTLEGRLVRWMFLFWVASLGTVITLLKL